MHKDKDLSRSRLFLFVFDKSVPDDKHSATPNSKIKHKQLWQNKIRIIIETRERGGGEGGGGRP